MVALVEFLFLCPRKVVVPGVEVLKSVPEEVNR